MTCLNENEVLALVQGTISGTTLESAQQHLQHCTDCLDLVTLVQQSYGDDNTATEDLPSEPASALEATQPGTFIGRYQVLRVLGRGGMGVVFEARDPKLDRLVAVKLVKPSLLGDNAQHFDRRLLREARAMARLSHPNVLTVYDVGVHEGQVFLASEWVDGETLEEWMAHEHNWRIVVARFRDAARGLVAAHEAGLVHRDFKPSNVMVGKDSRVRVFDFGLVRATLNTEGMNSTLGKNRVVGTPAYMSPEQMAGEPADERADQFSFCVSLYEALAHRRPFLGDDLVALHAAIEAGCVDDLKDVPGWLWDLIRRGLQRKTSARHPSMAALLESLEEGLGRRRRLSIAAVGSACVMGAALAVGGLWNQASDSAESCSGAELRFGDAWSAQRQDAVRVAMLNSAKPYAKHAWLSVSKNLGRYALDWEEESRASCIATSKGTQTHAVLARRSECFVQARVEFGVLREQLENGGEEVFLHASTLSQQLARLGYCSENLLARDSEVTANVAEREALRGLWPELKMVDLLVSTGKVETATALAEELLPLVQGHRPSEARLWSAQARALNAIGRPQDAVRSFEKAMYSATSGRDDELAAHATAQIYRYYATQLLDSKESERWKQLAEAATERAASVSARGHWSGIIGEAAMEAGHLVAAIGHYKSALEDLSSALGPEDHRVAAMAVQLGRVYLLAEEPAKAAGAFRRADSIWLATIGPKHPESAMTKAWLAIAVALEGDKSEAQRLGQEAMDVIVACYPESDPRLASMHKIVAKRQVVLGAIEAANRSLVRALELRRDADTLLDLAQVDAIAGNYEHAVGHGREAITLLGAGNTSPKQQRARLAFGELLFIAARLHPDEEEALVLALEAQENFSKAGARANAEAVEQWLQQR